MYRYSYAVAILLAFPALGLSIVPIVNLDGRSGLTVKGTLANNVESFLNIRVGASTAGSNRFAPPKAYTYPPGSVIDATQPGAACPQQMVPLESFPIFDNVTNISEDCLTLRVDRPANTSSTAKLPVMVYIYGGGDSIGQIYDSAYNPTILVSGAASNGFPIIYVAMNYRVGIFGFASSPALSAADSLNVALLDQRLALLWVQQNIEAFGGDPENDNIFGESDGATAVGLQITAYGGKVPAPFKRAVMQSGGATADAGTASNITAIHTAAVIKLVNCTSSDSSDELACLRALPLQMLLTAEVEYEKSASPFGGLDVFIPTSPSSFIPSNPSELLYSGQFAHDIDIITGWNENDDLISDTDVSEFLASTYPGLSKQNIKNALALYPKSSFPNDAAENVTAQYFRTSQIVRDSEFTCPSLLTVQINLKYSQASTQNYLYSLNQTVFEPIFAELHASYYGVSHLSDIPFVFNQATTRYASEASPADISLSSRMSTTWASFATSGNPSHGSATIQGWSAAKASAGLYDMLIIGGPDSGLRGIDHGQSYYEDLMTRCAFWNSKDVLIQIQV
ncbi:Secreted lipase [Lachnellula willkommii]|uniref:Secreted lipase n=1 Tax=Lachnellula willkommii TaxID=215461 RepID=A0A559MFA7_9HELO|nr:Secreted lipase [Lachnellula willkommii]